MKLHRRSRLALALIVIVALAVRLATIAVDGDYRPEHDSLDYDRHARSIAADARYPEAIRVIAPEGGPTAFRPPGYPVFLAGVYKVTGDSVTAGRIANALLGALAVFLIYLVARQLFSRRVALLAAALAAIYPPLVALSLELYSESLFIVLLLAAVLAALRYRTDPRLGTAATAGLLAGGAVLTRPNGILLVPFIAWALWQPRRPTFPSFAAPALATLIALLALTPWIARNELTLARFVPLSTGAGFNLAGVYNDEARSDERFNAAWRLPIRIDAYDDIYAVPDQREVDLDDRLRERGLDYATDNPDYVAEVIFWSTLRTLNLADAGTASSTGLVSERGIGVDVTKAEPVGFFIVAGLALAGIVALLRRPPGRRGPGWIWLMAALLVAATLPIIGLPRYRAPAEPFIVILAALGTVAMWQRLRAVREPRRGPEAQAGRPG